MIRGRLILHHTMAGVLLSYVGVAAYPPGHGQSLKYGSVHRSALYRDAVWTARDSVPLATITTDTGAFAPGDKEFSRFTVPGMCIAAVEEARDVSRRSLPDQITAVLQDSVMTGASLPATARSVARACAARFTVRGTAAEDLPDLFQLYLMAGEDSLAQAVVNRRLELAKDVNTRAAVLQTALEGYVTAEPARIAAAETSAARIDALGPTAQAARINAHGSLLEFARTSFDESYMRREVGRITALDQETPPSTIQSAKETVFLAYQALAQIAYIEQPDSVMAVVTRAKQDLGRFGVMPAGIAVHIPMLLNDFSTMSPLAIRDAFVPFNVEQYAGQPLPPVSAAYWFPKAPSGWPPGEGRPSLVIYGGLLLNNCARYDMILWIGANVKRPECGALFTYLPQWAKRYGQGLTVTLVSQTAGSAARSLVLPPAAEADSLRWFFLDHLNLPVTLGVVVDSAEKTPDFAGREDQADVDTVFRYSDTTFYGRLRGKPAESWENSYIVLLYGEHGKLQYRGPWNAPVLRKLLDRVVGGVTSSAMRPERP